jgi:hypothetical protein
MGPESAAPKHERTAIAVAALGTAGVVFAQAYSALAFGAGTWRVAVYVASLASFAGATVAALALLVPPRVVPILPEPSRADRIVLTALALFALGLVLTAALLAAAAVDAIGRTGPWDLYEPG